jgi:protein involved in polysaccharide export with SLBB domain
VVLSLLFSGCASYKNSVQSQQIVQESEFFAESSPYEETEVRLSPGDELDIRFFYTPELNTIQPIRPDGKIALQLIGEVMAQGMTPFQLQEELVKKYSKHLLQIDVTVIVLSFSNRVVYVGGQVARPGAVPFTPQMTVLEALMLAGGVRILGATMRSKYRNVMVLRTQNGKWIGVELDLEKVLKGEQSKPYYLWPLDIVYVTESLTY